MDDESELEQVWVEFALLQKRIGKRKVVDHKTWALEDQAEAFLEAVATDSLPNETNRRDKWLHNLETNRQKKHRHRSEILQRWIPDFTVPLDKQPPIDRIIIREQLLRVRNSATVQEFRILCSRAFDQSYETIADAEQMSIGAVKIKVHRCRQRLRVYLQTGLSRDPRMVRKDLTLGCSKFSQNHAALRGRTSRSMRLAEE